MKPLQTGLALSVTVAVFYALCTLAEVMWPQQFMGFMNALFHGMNFRSLQSGEPFRWQSFVLALVVMALWAFAMGAFFAWLSTAIHRPQLRGMARHG